MLAVVAVLILQQAASGQVVWHPPAPPTPVVAEIPAVVPALPDWARADPYGYERSECSPLIRAASESMEACQSRVRRTLAAHLGAALPVGLSAGGAEEQCRQAAAGDRYALQCGSPSRADVTGPALAERTCRSRPQARPEGGVTWVEECRQADGRPLAEGGLRLRLGDDD